MKSVNYNTLGLPIALDLLHALSGLLLSPMLAASSGTVISNANRRKLWRLEVQR